MSTDYKIIGSEYFTAIDRNALEEIVTNGSYNKELVYSSKPWFIAL
jgi:hypothetical protein